MEDTVSLNGILEPVGSAIVAGELDRLERLLFEPTAATPKPNWDAGPACWTWPGRDRSAATRPLSRWRDGPLPCPMTRHGPGR